MTRTAPVRRIALLGAIGLVAASVAFAAPASAHSYLVSSTPGEGEVVATLPAQFSVTANEPLLDLSGDASGFAIQVVDASGAFYGDGCFVVSGSTLSMGATLGAPGDYRMYWQVISADGHPVSGEVPFSWSGSGETAGLASPPVCGETGAEPKPSPSATATEPSAEPTPIATTAPVDENEGMPLDLTTIGLAVLAALGAIAVILLAIRALRGMGKDDDTTTPPPAE